MVELTIDGMKVEVPEGSMVMHAVEKLGSYVPHFCYHKKLSIAANCRMCLVDVEKAPKPLPACATPVTQGMVVHTANEKAKKAQQGVMEFLLINHPLDCPICDQGGECQLQDLAVGYGKSGSRYEEEKRVVFHKSLGPLISAEEMSRCIHCTRCVRFGQEVAGVMELGMLNRGEHSEITSFLGRGIESELSGNMIDVCPVGALTSKPFRYSARTWELSRRKSVSPHDSLGANVVVQVKANRVMRVLPYEVEDINECWISDRDRFSYEALNSEDRLLQPMLKRDGTWEAVDWPTALASTVEVLGAARGGGSAALGALYGSLSTTEEIFLLNKLIRALGSDNIDYRVAHREFAADSEPGIDWLGMSVAEVGQLDRVLLVGSDLRKDHPVLAARIRTAAKRGTKVSVVHSTDDDLLMPIAAKCIVRPSAIAQTLAQIAVALAKEKGVAAPASLHGVQPTECASVAAKSLASGSRVGVFLGNAALHSVHSGSIRSLAAWIARQSGGRFGVLGEGANAVGAQALGAVRPGGPVQSNSLLVMNLEPQLDGHLAALLARSAQRKIALTPFRSAAEDWADIMLPIAPWSETPGSFVNAEGRLQTFNASVKPQGEARPGWKVLRVLGEQLRLGSFTYDSAEAVRAEALGEGFALSGKLGEGKAAVVAVVPQPVTGGLECATPMPIYRSDLIVRRANSLQQTADAKPPMVAVHPDTAAQLGLVIGSAARVRSQSGEAVLPVSADESVPAGVVRLPAGHAATNVFGGDLQVSVERI
ncbi:NADH-quinone oxidoreductase subunit NuoG [Piscinibacterium candidicorallinum]|uniref:NADH-quinone oxidoreductase n=1 Tax=Piscinibacterium candidicorallinum TaxID=1793872 RepID=A0ABV7H1N4_9BURK